MRSIMFRRSFLAAAVLLMLAYGFPMQTCAENYLASPEAFMQRFGPPDAIETTENDRPRPMFVTKSLIYKKERVEFIFVTDPKPGEQPPYQKWFPMGAIDIKKKSSLNPDEALNRLEKRRRPR